MTRPERAARSSPKAVGEGSIRRIAILGTGLIGGSIGLGLRTARCSALVVGYDRNPASLECALERNAVDETAATPEDAVRAADVVIVALPVDRIPVACAKLSGSIPLSAIVTDVGSAKGEVVVEGERSFGERFVGGHPMAGSERHGMDAADGALFDGAWWVLTPTAATSPAAYATVSDMVQSLGATPVAVGPDVHDSLVARLSHVPQLAASALVDAAVASGGREALLGLAAGGFRDITRIAASDPDLWVAIIRSNTAAVHEALGALGDRLGALADLVAQGRWGELHTFLSRARAARLELFAKPAYTGQPVALTMMVPDRPGVLAEVTTAAGQLGANIEDLRIVHSTEGGRGRLELIVAGEDAATSLVEVLHAHGYRAERASVDLSPDR
ncbi:prephenate dehydrogenase [soil metagenome]